MYVCIDGVKSMMGSIKVIVSRIKKENLERSNFHCSVHRHQLVSKGMPSDFSSVLVDVIKIVNFIKSRPLRARIFFIICKDMGSLDCNLLLHTSVRWASRGKELVRVFKLLKELLTSFEKNEFSLSCRPREPKLQCLACIADILLVQ